MRVTIIGSGYVGLVTGACLAEVGNDVMCLDVDEKKIQGLQKGIIPIYEPGLESMIRKCSTSGHIRFTTDIEAAVHHGEFQIIAVGTPPGENGSADLQHVLSAARNIGKFMRDYKIVIDKSTVPVGTGDKVRAEIQAQLTHRGINSEFSVVSNPEFLKEGAALSDFMRPDRIVIGADNDRALQSMRQLYSPFNRNHDRLMAMDIRSAELTKYAANAMLASRISFMNELAILAEATGADIEHVRLGIGSDQRIGYSFLYAGIGYGGSCFPKDVRALQKTAMDHGVDLKIVSTLNDVNNRQKQVIVDKIIKRFGNDLKGKQFALWGLAFKPNTDDIREAPSLEIIRGLTALGATIVAYDPIATETARIACKGLPGVTFTDKAINAIEGSIALIIATEWQEFKSPDFAAIKGKLSTPTIFDGRNLYDPQYVASCGLEYFSMGRPTPSIQTLH